MRRYTLAAAAATAVLILAIPGAATAQQRICGERTGFLKHLGKNYAESPTAMGLASNGSMLEVLTSEAGSWTIIVTNPHGITCLVAAGESWDTMPRIAMKPSA